jgi:hypothetical protein
MSTDQQVEEQIQAKGLTAPRITYDHIEGKILSKHFFTASQAVNGCNRFGFKKVDGEFVPYTDNVEDGALSTLTFCVLVLENGFTVTGESACASVENFDKEIGEAIAYNNAVQKIWMLEGYLLKNDMHLYPELFDGSI